MSVNKAILVGHLGADPERRDTTSGGAVVNLRLATNEAWTDRDGKKQERTEWHRVVAFGRVAETCAEYLRKGRQVYVEGRLQTREWQDKDGGKRMTTEIVADRVDFLGGGERRDERAPDQAPRPRERQDAPRPTAPAGPDDDIPFRR